MSKELPFFKFYPAEWLIGKISFQPMEIQGAFTQCCCMFWQLNGKMKESDIDFRIGKDFLNKLKELGFIKENGEYIYISFLDEQLSEYDQVREKQRLAGAIGGKSSASKKSRVAKGTLKAPSRGAVDTLKDASSEIKQSQAEKKRKEVDKIEIREDIEEEKKIKDSIVAVATDQEEKSIYPIFLTVYDEFIIKKTGGPAKIDGEQGKAAKAIISYLRKRPKVVDDETLIEAWNWVLRNWDNLEDYQKKKIKLSEISSDITKIFDQLNNNYRNGATVKKPLTTTIKVTENTRFGKL